MDDTQLAHLQTSIAEVLAESTPPGFTASTVCVASTQSQPVSGLVVVLESKSKVASTARAAYQLYMLMDSIGEGTLDDRSNQVVRQLQLPDYKVKVMALLKQHRPQVRTWTDAGFIASESKDYELRPSVVNVIRVTLKELQYVLQHP